MIASAMRPETGDRVLNSVVNAVQDAVRPMDLLGRFGGEEFLILLPDTSPESAFEVAERVRKQVEATQSMHHDQRIHVTASIGVAVWNGNASLDELIRRADNALYQAKAAGRNRVQITGDRQG
jgi:diguanylate cyclase